MTKQIINNNEESQQLYEHHNFTVDLNQSTIRIDKFLFDKLPNVTRNKLQEAIKISDREAIKDEIGDLLLSVVNLARYLKLDAEESLRKSNKKFEKRFRFIESELK